jgi:hypothetical protein
VEWNVLFLFLGLTPSGEFLLEEKGGGGNEIPYSENAQFFFFRFFS